MKWQKVAACGVLALIIMITGCVTRTAPAIPVVSVDLTRMYGDWYIVATIPNVLERGMVAPHDVYSPAAEKTIREDFYMHRGSFSAKQQHFVTTIHIRSNTSNGDWRVQLFWPLRIPWQIFYVDADYRYALFGEQNRNWAWIYSRTPDISDCDYQELLERFAYLGYDSRRLQKVVQAEEQIGQPGFWSESVKARPNRTQTH